MCGASSEQKDMYAAQSQLYREMSAQYSQVFGKQQRILDELTSTFMPILKAGPNQRGFSDEERTILETQATEGVANNFDKAQAALNENLAARGGSDFIPSGADNQMREGLASVAAAEKSNLDQQITQADFAEGSRLWQAAAGALGGVASELNPVGFANATTGAGSAAADTANNIAAASNAIWGSVIGGLSGVAGAAVGGWAGKQKGGCWIAAAVYDGWEDPRTITVREWLNTEFVKTWYGRLVMKVYMTVGEAVANRIHKHPALKRVFKPMFDLALRKAQSK